AGGPPPGRTTAGKTGRSDGAHARRIADSAGSRSPGVVRQGGRPEAAGGAGPADGRRSAGARGPRCPGAAQAGAQPALTRCLSHEPPGACGRITVFRRPRVFFLQSTDATPASSHHDGKDRFSLRGDDHASLLPDSTTGPSIPGPRDPSFACDPFA